ncbi:MAG: hypothetical protein K0R22_1846 [Sporomusa sp.]|jgi:hypothetical protein|nr:hypothetical protein [Sporomusa sp.]
MKKLIKGLTCLIVILSFTCTSAIGAPAANASVKAGQILNYTETFTPAGKNDATLTVTVEGVSNKAGEIYVFISQANMTQTAMKLKLGNVTAADGKPGKIGSSSYLIYKTASPEEKYAIELTFTCRDFYKGTAYEPDTGVSGQVSLKYKTVNTQSYDIVNYKVRIYLAKGQEFSLISSPKKDYIVGRDPQSDLRYLEYALSGSAEKPAFRQAREVSISAVHGTPVKGVSAVLLWMAAIGLGVSFFLLEYKKVFKTPQKSLTVTG